MKRIEPGEKSDRPVTSDQLESLGRLFSRRMQIQCGYCKMRIQMTIEGGELRLGSSPDMTEINPEHRPKPRLVFYCGRCKRILGFIQGDVWSGEHGAETPTRWDRLELEE
ncbi:MAG: hypothetical protein SFU56_05535 [Capsulimonadales bacterium]|nr:hypothetical protein [Capsulimonadales bacterium]